MVALAIDRDQLRNDGKKAAACLLLFGLVIGFFGAVLEIIGVFDVVPPIGDKVIAVVLLVFYAFAWKDEIQMVAAGLRRLPLRIYRRYTVEENTEEGATE